MIIHGTKDSLVPSWMGATLAAEAEQRVVRIMRASENPSRDKAAVNPSVMPVRVRFVPVSAGHNDVLMTKAGKAAIFRAMSQELAI